MGWSIRAVRDAVKGERSARLNNYFFLVGFIQAPQYFS